jgi:hypothetical protein
MGHVHGHSTSTGELLGPPITGAIYDATKSWHCVIAFSGTVQVVGAFALLYGALTPYACEVAAEKTHDICPARFKREPSVFKVY